MNKNFLLCCLGLLLLSAPVAYAVIPGLETHPAAVQKVKRDDSALKKTLPPAIYNVACEGGTERPFTGAYWNHHAKGDYGCVICGLALFSSANKYDSGTGWPSFYKAINAQYVETKTDTSFGMKRTEITCARCGAHLGHVFEDGPNPTGLRYCVNSASLQFYPAKK